MGKTIKRKEVIAYKGMKSDMSCRGFYYEIGKSYKTDKVKLCDCGFHACLNPIDVLDYYSQRIKSRYFKVKLFGEITKCDNIDTKVAATEITIIEEINIKELRNITEWWENDNVLDLLYWSDGFARVQREDKRYNIIDKQGNILFNEWLYWVGDFLDGLALVQRERENPRFNYIDKEGKIISDEWFRWVDFFRDGIARVQREDYSYNLIDMQGNILSEEWFEWIDDFNEYDRAVVYRTNGECCKIDKNGKIVVSK